MFFHYSRWPVVNNSNKRVFVFLLYFISFETINCYISFIKISYLDQTYSIKKTANNYKKCGQQWQHCFVKLCTKFQGKPASRSGTGARWTYQPMIFTCFTSSSPSEFSWHSSFNLARSTCSFCWCYIFFFCNHFYLKYKYIRKNTC